MNARTVEELKADIVNAAMIYGEDLGSGRRSTKISDNAHDAAKRAFEELKAQHEERRILDLLEFGHPAVRLMAAGFALQSGLDTDRGQAVLESLANGPFGSIRSMADSLA